MSRADRCGFVRSLRASMASLAAAASIAGVAGCADEAPQPSGTAAAPLPAREVVVYVSADEAVARPILAAFERDTGIRVRARYDTEASKATALADMLRAERDAPRADCLWSGETLATARLAGDGVLAPHRGARADAMPDGCRGESGRWYAFAARPRVLAYRPSVTDPASLPKSWIELVDAREVRTVAMADPRFGTTRGHVMAMSLLPEGRGAAWIEALAARKPRILPGGNAAVVDAVWRGEVELGMTDEDDVRAARLAGADVACVALPMSVEGAHAGEGVVMTPSSVAFVAGAPHPAEATAFIEWLLQPRTEAWLSASRSGNRPIAWPDASASVDVASGWPEGLERGDAYRCDGGATAAALEWDMVAREGGPGLERLMSLCAERP